MEHLNDSLFLILGNLDLGNIHLANLDFHLNFFVTDHTDYFLIGKVRDADVMGQMQNAWNNFVKTGQIWALIIGIILGYMFRSLVTYG